jgi:hypothetical protein
VERWGLDWLTRGTARLTLARPVYEGDEVEVAGRVIGRSGGETAGEVAVELTATVRGEAAATLVGGLAWGAEPALPALAGYPAAPLPATRPPAEAAVLGRPGPLGSPALCLDDAAAAAFARDVGDDLPVYRGSRPALHPGILLQQANRALSENVVLGPWVHVSSDVAHGSVARAGDRLETRGRVARVFEKRGHHFVDLDLLVVADGTRPILHVRHTAIYALRAGARG